VLKNTVNNTVRNNTVKNTVNKLLREGSFFGNLLLKKFIVEYKNRYDGYARETHITRKEKDEMKIEAVGIRRTVRR
jgi:hypothetical protein